tara:strand:- start:159 stop:455 length:297 start_codon:yes stop_codon:yes gene_type:complete
MIINKLNLNKSTRTDGNFFQGIATDAAQVHHDLRSLEFGHFWMQESSFSDGFSRSIWINIPEKLILTYCEGDLLLQTFDNALDFYHSLNEAALFYKDN